MHAFRAIESPALAKAEYRLTQDIVSLLQQDTAALDRLALLPAPQEPTLLQAKYQLMTCLAEGVRQASLLALKGCDSLRR